MTTFTIDNDNSITAFPTPEAAHDTLALGAQPFTSQKDLAKLTAEWPISHLVEAWNAFAGTPGFQELRPVKKFTDRKSAVARIWQAVQRLEAAPESASAAPQAPPVAPATPKATKDTTRAKRAPTAAQRAKEASPRKKASEPATKKEAGEARDGSKKALVVAMLQRKNGATLSEIMDKMGWQKHTVRGFMAGAMKKAGYTVESFKPEGGERTYRINS